MFELVGSRRTLSGTKHCSRHVVDGGALTQLVRRLYAYGSVFFFSPRTAVELSIVSFWIRNKNIININLRTWHVEGRHDGLFKIANNIRSTFLFCFLFWCKLTPGATILLRNAVKDLVLNLLQPWNWSRSTSTRCIRNYQLLSLALYLFHR